MEFAASFDWLTQGFKYIGLEVDQVVSCHELPSEAQTGSVTSSSVVVVVEKSTGLIVGIHPSPCELAETKILHFSGCSLLPGFIDCHVHLSIATDDYQVDHLRLSSADKSLRCLRAAQGLLHAGFTTIRSAGDGDTFFPSFAVAKSINRKEFIGPTIVGAGHYISVTGGGGDINFFSPDNASCCQVDGVIADGKDAMIAAVRKEIKYGSDWVKILATGAFMSASTNAKDSPENTHFSREELLTVVEEGARRRVPVMAHAHGAEGIAMAASLGCRSIEHASFIDETGVEACLANGTWIVPTFLIGEYYKQSGSATGAQDRMIYLMNATDERNNQCIRRAASAGVKIALGSDFVGWDPKITAREFRLLVERAQLSPLDAIRAGTLSAADMLDLPGPPRGQIAIGSLADIVIVRGNPLTNIEVLETAVAFVMKGGIIARYDDELRCMQCASRA